MQKSYTSFNDELIESNFIFIVQNVKYGIYETNL